MKTTNKSSQILKGLAIGGLLTLTGCVSIGGGETATDGKIATINFNLPQQIKWSQSKNSQNKDGSMLAEWIPQGSKPNNTPVRIIYQRLVPGASAQTFIGNALQPLQKVCTDIKINPFKATSQYPNQANAEVLCAQLGKNRFGTVSYVSVFSDKAANHLVISEVKMPASKKAGVLDFKTAQQKKQAQDSSALAKLMYQFNNSIRACDSKQKCL